MLPKNNKFNTLNILMRLSSIDPQPGLVLKNLVAISIMPLLKLQCNTEISQRSMHYFQHIYLFIYCASGDITPVQVPAPSPHTASPTFQILPFGRCYIDISIIKINYKYLNHHTSTEKNETLFCFF